MEYTQVMGAIGTYFRAHRWQRRTLTVLAAVIVAMGATVLLRSPIREYLLLRDLGSGDAKVRESAIGRGVYLGRQYPHVVTRLNEALSTENDQQFHAITRVLSALGALRVAGRDPNQLDRLRLIEFLTTRPPAPGQGGNPATSQVASRASAAADIAADTRLLLFQDAVFVGRDDPYTRRLLATAACDESPAIRQASAVLAARFADANTLLRLLGDPDANVVEWAAIDSALARVPGTHSRVHDLFEGGRNPNAIGGAAFAVTQTGPDFAVLRQRLMEANDPRLRDQLLFVARDSNSRQGCEMVAVLAERLRDSVRYLPEGLFYFPYADDVETVLKDAVSDPNGPSRLQILAAIQAAGEQWPAELEAILRTLWTGPNAAILVTAAENLLPGSLREPNAIPIARCKETLREASQSETPEDPNDPDFALAVPAAAAAVALWRNEPLATLLLPEVERHDANAPAMGTSFDANSTAYLVYLNSCREHQLPPDYISWHLARSGRVEAFELGMNLLPLPPDPRVSESRRGFRNYSANSRETAAMLLALSARTPEQKKAAVARIAARLEGGPLGAPTDFYEIGTYQCALLILGEAKYRQNVEGLLATGAFPVRRAITALCAAGVSDPNAGRAALDWLLWDTQVRPGEIADILVGTGLEEVLRVLVPELPTVDAAADDDLRNWQVRIMQDYYRIHREKIRFAQRQ